MLSRKMRLGGQKQVSRVYREGRAVRGGQLSVKLAPNQLEYNRWSVVVSKKVAKSAVKRNRIRRRIYGLLDRAPGKSPYHDAIISVFDEGISSMPSEELNQKIQELLKRAGLS